ncbi:MAG: (2Fe-2S)-binding protein [Bryobacterales bacterium]|nr:(2Fe-2S)-binding protein [Bryobacterales bacterium]
MAEPVRVQFKVNGVDREVECWPMERLLDVLREHLRLTGAKEGCGEGECGACAVLMDGRLVNSCLVPALEAAGRTVTTIEGLANHPVVDAFCEGGAAQCGICTPGMVVATVDALARNVEASEDQLRKHLAGNLCRCTGYRAVLESALAALAGTKR